MNPRSTAYIALLALCAAATATMTKCVMDEAGVVQPSPSPTVIPSITPSPSSSPSPSPTPSPTATVGKVQVLDTFERPEAAAEAQWKQSITRTILDGQTTSVVVRTSDPCSLASIVGINKMVPMVLTKPSAPTYTAGTYYDPLQPLTSANCVGAKYLQMDLTNTYTIGDAQINVVKKLTKAPVQPTIQLSVEFNNINMLMGYCGQYCNFETAAFQGLQLLKDHRISPYKGNPGYTSTFFNQYVLPYQLKDVWFAAGSPPAFPAPSIANLWAYVMDEPGAGQETQLTNLLSNWKFSYPTVKRMVTTPIRHRDLTPTSPTYGKIIDYPASIKDNIDIFSPVAEEFCVETWKGSGDVYPCLGDYAGRQLWLYVSNMAHGNEGAAATGSPDLVIDRTAVEAFGFFVMGLKYNVNGLLYYNSIQGWEVWKTDGTGRDVWLNPYQYGGEGDGLLLYPDRANKIALASIRLKLLREASQTIDIIVAAGLRSEAAALMTNPLVWQRDLSKIEALRTKALSMLQ
jgi:hypothetical protein